MTAHCVAVCFTAPGAAVATVATVTEDIGNVLFETLVEIKVDLCMIFLPLAARRRCSQRLCAAWWTVWRIGGLLFAAAALVPVGWTVGTLPDGLSDAGLALTVHLPHVLHMKKVYA